MLSEDFIMISTTQKEYRAILLTSYCDNPKCTEDYPCIECVKMCNVITFSDPVKIEVHSGFDRMKELNI